MAGVSVDPQTFRRSMRQTGLPHLERGIVQIDRYEECGP
ncbi:hypothetical protein GFS60_07881 (plasmid) [Rhodococcus sp. WAY2]|nr:hypothetical protein GFS60_07881 [Rhodococcus sp. WAY2]